jgi:hypothetical protein
MEAKKFWNPYVAGVALGLVLLASFLLLGRGLGASGAANRLGILLLDTVAHEHLAGHSHLATFIADGNPLLNYPLAFMVLGVFIGGLVSAYTSGRLNWEVVRGANISDRGRLALALAGGVLMGIAARLALGCTSGQALSGGALLSVGSWIFMLSVFAGGYGAARLVRRQWS